MTATWRRSQPGRQAEMGPAAAERFSSAEMVLGELLLRLNGRSTLCLELSHFCVTRNNALAEKLVMDLSEIVFQIRPVRSRNRPHPASLSSEIVTVVT